MRIACRLWLLALPVLPGLAAGASRVPTAPAVTRATPADGAEVTCVGRVCRHAGAPFRSVVEGLKIVGNAVVFRQHGGWGVTARVALTPADGHPHQMDRLLAKSGTIRPLPGRSSLESSGFDELTSAGHVSMLRPGQIWNLSVSYPDRVDPPEDPKEPILPGNRLYLTIRLTRHLLAANGPFSEPRLMTIVLTVPDRGTPRVRIGPPH